MQLKKNNKALIFKSAVLGFLEGDGTVEKRKINKGYHYEVRLFADDKEMIHSYTQAVEYVYNKRPSINLRDNVYHVRLTSKTVVSDLLKEAKFRTIDWNIPEKLINNKARKIAWIKAFFSAEAYVGKYHIKIQTIHKSGMKQVSKILNELNIKHSEYTYQPKKENHKEVSIIHIRNRHAREKFFNEIGFWHSKKTKALKKALGL